MDLVDCILADNQAEEGENLWLGSAGASFPGGVIAMLDHCLIKDATTTVRVGHMTLIQASPVLTGDPLFMAGPGGDHYLSQTTDGQLVNSPGLDAGSDLAMNICTGGGDETVCLDTLATRTTGVADTGVVDLGYHYPAANGTVSASMGCAPSTGNLSFTSQFTVSLTNLYPEQTRRIAGRINVLLAGGQVYSSWRAGYTNVSAGAGYLTTWVQSFPAIGSLVGNNLFSLVAEDVTPAPYNSPPYPPAGDTATATCTVAGVAP